MAKMEDDKELDMMALKVIAVESQARATLLSFGTLLGLAYARNSAARFAKVPATLSSLCFVGIGLVDIRIWRHMGVLWRG
jgi:hypothetical protein